MLKQKLAIIKTVQNDSKNKTGFLVAQHSKQKNAKRLNNKYFVESK